jgi:hypothetical protein
MKMNPTVWTIALLAVLFGTNSAFGVTLFTTQEDFSGWPPNSGTNMSTLQVGAPDLDGSTTNGAGNTSNPGGAGTGGSLQTTWVAGAFNYFFSQGEQGNAAFMSAIGGSTASIGSGISGDIKFDYTKPPAGSGNYFQLGVVLNYTGNFGQFFGTEVDNGNGTFTATVPYTLNPVGSLTYFQLGLIYNSNYNTNTPFYVDNIRAENVVPEPHSVVLISLAGLALVGGIRLRRARR